LTPSGAYSLVLSTWSSGVGPRRGFSGEGFGIGIGESGNREPGAWQRTQRYKSRLDRCVCDSQKFPEPPKLDWDSDWGSGIGTGYRVLGTRHWLLGTHGQQILSERERESYLRLRSYSVV